MGTGIFITGTDTEVGKTVVTAGILRYLRNAGIDAVPMKPASTGGEPGPKGLEAPDLLLQLAAAGLTPPPEERAWMAPYVYEPACSPHLAGRMAGRYPEMPHIVDCLNALTQRHDVVVVEGAGGIYVPLDEDVTMLDLMRTLGFPVILVARRGLGTINHTLLSLETLRRADLEVAGVVLNECDGVEEDFIRKDNAATIARFAHAPLIGNVGNIQSADGQFDWEAFDAACPGLAALAEKLQ